MSGSGPLSAIRVVETATGVAGPYVGKLLGDLGADVTKIEPAGGDPSRRHGPFPGGEPDPDRSALFLFLNGAKSAAGPDALDELVAGASLVIDDGTLDVDELRSRDPRLVVCSVTPFGLTGPYAGYRADDIELYAIGGAMIQTGLLEREPLKLAGNQVQYQCGAIGAYAALGAVMRAERSGVGAHIDLSAMETQVGSIDRQINHLLWRQWTGMEVTRAPGGAPSVTPIGNFPCADGHVALVVIPNWLPRLLAVLDDPELTERCSDPDWARDPDTPGLLEVGVYNWLADRTRQQAMADGAVHRLPFAPFNGPADLVTDPHFVARGFFEDRDGDPIPRPAVRFHAGPVPPADAPPAPADTRPTGPDARPLDGVRVIDLTEVWSGPYATMLLGDMGAEVIRVDNPWFFPAITRGAFARPARESLEAIGAYTACYPDMDPGERPWNRSGNYVAHSRSKKSCTLELRSELGREMYLRLVERADVVIENASIGVMDRLGIGWDTLVARNPRLIMVRMPALGLDGPYRDFVGFGTQMEAMGGSAALSGYIDADPSEKSAVYPMDPAAGTHAALCTLAALRQRDADGLPALVEVTQIEVILQHVGELLIDAAWSGHNSGAPGNRHVTHAPQGCYPCVGDDAWLALTVDSDDAWAALCEAMGDPTWARDPQLATTSGRRARHDEIDERLAEWTRDRDAVDLFHRLQAVGVMAAPVANQAAQLADPHLEARGFYRTNSSADVPETTVPGHLWRWDGPELAWGPFNRLGDHNEYVFRELLGLDDDEYATLDREGHLSEDYLDADGAPL